MSDQELSVHEQTVKSSIDRLAQSAREGGMVREDDLTFEGSRFVIPRTMDLRAAIRFLEERQEQDETSVEINRTFDYRPMDGAHAFDAVLRRELGASGTQKAMSTMFGEVPPPLESVKIGPAPEDRVQVPFGMMSVDAFEGMVRIGGTRTRKEGIKFKVEFEIKRKWRAHAEGLLDLVEEELRTNSIYRGKAIDANDEPTFLDLSTVDVEQAVYASDTMRQLEANVWAMLRHTDELERIGAPLKRSVLFEGNYGTGKTLAAFATARIAVEHGWTFIYCRPEHDLIETMATARLYQPSVVFFEDVDTTNGQRAGGSDASRLLDAFDGITAKGTKILAVMTTNHAERIHPGMVRPGRLDAVIHFDELDRAATEELVRRATPDGALDEGIDFDAVRSATTGYAPAFVREVVDRAVRYSIAREGGHVGRITTEDLVDAADGLRPQLALMHAERPKDEDPFELSLRKAVADAMNGSEIENEDAMFEMTTPSQR